MVKLCWRDHVGFALKLVWVLILFWFLLDFLAHGTALQIVLVLLGLVGMIASVVQQAGQYRRWLRSKGSP